MKPRHTFAATSVVALLTVAGVTAAIAADPADPMPPRIAFLANGVVPADALAAGPIAGQLGAPIYTTQSDVLPGGTATALTAYDPELVIVLGGPVAITDAVVDQVAAATGLVTVPLTPTPAAGIVRAAGADRFATATIVADLLAAYAPAYLPSDRKAADADLLDGRDATAFADVEDVPIIEMVQATGTATAQPPDPLPSDRLFTDELDVTFATTATGRLHLTYQASFGLDCSPGSEWAWLVLDGTPIPSSAIILPSGASAAAHHTLTAVTTEPVQAGVHRVEVHAGGEQCGTFSNTVNFYASGTVLVLDG